MVNYGFASATLALTAAAVATAQEAVTPQPTYWPTYWPTYSPTDVHDGKYDRHSPPARDGNPNYESSEKPTDPTPVRPSLVPPIAALTEGPTSSPTKEPTSSPTNAPTQRPQDQPTTPSPTASTDPPTQHPVAPPTTPPPPPTPQKWGSSWGDSASSSKSSWSNALKGDSKWGGSDSPKVMSLEWGGKADKWGGKTAKWGTSKAGKSWCNTTKSSKECSSKDISHTFCVCCYVYLFIVVQTEWSTGWESSEWQSPQPEWKSPEWQPPKQNWVSPGWESGSGWKRPKQPGSSARPDNAPRKLYTWPKRTYLNYDVEAAPESWEGVTPKADKEVPLWDDDGWSEPETSMTAWDSWSTSKASKATGEGWGLSMSMTTWDSWSTSKASKATGEGWGLAKASKWVGSKGGKSSCWESGDGGDNGSGWGWQPSWPSPPPTWGKPPAPTPPCVNNQSYNCEGLGGTGSWYCQGMVDGCADGQEYHPSCVVTEKPATE
eukprot:scaffold32804_cov131-Skeletonema_menzelii.AAC.1